jgi:hypothetical protein
MKIMTWFATVMCLVILGPGSAFASDADDLRTLLQDFLKDSSTKEAHASFWAEDLIYTSSAGLRFGKADIMAGFEDAVPGDEAADDEPTMTYSGEDIDIRLYGDTAIVAFRLVGTPTDKSSDRDVLYYFNTGTFLKKNGVWKAIAWQATKIPPT